MTTTFADLGVSRPVIETLRARGIDAPFPVQSLVLGDAMAGLDVLARSNTGSGKTLAFALPIVERIRPNDEAPAALVLVPTRELAQQVADEFADIAKVKGLRVGVAYGGTNVKEQSRGLGRAHVLIATPGRLQDIAERKLVRLDRVRILILDEADRMLDMGFQPQVDRIVRRIPKDRQTMFFSATLDGAVGNLARAYTRDPIRHEVESIGETVEGVEHRFVQVSVHSKVEALLELLEHDGGLSLVFVRTKRGADRLVHKLRAKGVRAEGMHGDMPQRARQRALERFENSKVDVLVATDVAARGLDLQGISHVVNYDPPQDDKGYVHRVGRTARAGGTGTGITLVTADQQGDIGRMAARLELGEAFEGEGMKVAPPRVVFSASAKGRRSGLRPPRRRKF
ncbi:MAG TPA: DEAD/DEAH box helicase [Actinomycetota bacterium]|jgi:ATP-dependent RNA helicase RhlE|nr:DEAD/DEAH box helicase [Actinomycetota bacterium]